MLEPGIVELPGEIRDINKNVQQFRVKLYITLGQEDLWDLLAILFDAPGNFKLASAAEYDIRNAEAGR